MPEPNLVISLMAAIAAGEIAEGVASALLTGGFEFGTAAATDWYAAAGAATAGGIGLGGLLYGAMSTPASTRRRRRERSTQPRRRNVRRRLFPPPASGQRPGELKRVHYHTIDAGYNPTNAWAIVPMDNGAGVAVTTRPLSGVAVGDDKNSRIGNKLHAKMINIQGMILFEQITGTNTTQFVKFALIYDKVGAGAAPTPSQVYEDRTGLASHRVMDFRDEDWTQRYSVVAEWTAVNHTDGAFRHHVPFRKDIALNKELVYQTNADTYAAVATGTYTLIACGSPGTANNVRFQAMFKFTE